MIVIKIRFICYIVYIQFDSFDTLYFNKPINVYGIHAKFKEGFNWQQLMMYFCFRKFVMEDTFSQKGQGNKLKIAIILNNTLCNRTYLCKIPL